MAHFKMQVVVPILLLMLLAAAEAKPPPGIAKNPSNARVECVSCKPICPWGSSPHPHASPTPSPTPPTYYSPPPPQAKPTPPPSPPTPTPPTPSLTPPTTTPIPLTPSLSPSPPTPTPHYQSPPPTLTTPTPSPRTSSSPSPSTPTSSPRTSSSPPPTPSTSPKKAKCKNKYYPHCYNIEHVCPSSCPGGCEVDCVTGKPVCKCDQPGAVCQGPGFIGGDGITFYFHGKKDRDFCLLSNPNLHINAHFIGRRNHNMKREFTWVQSIAILFGKHQLFLGAQKTATWDDSTDCLALSFDGEPITLPESEGASWQSTSVPTVSLTRVAGTNNVMAEVEGSFRITAKVVPITEEDSRIHK